MIAPPVLPWREPLELAACVDADDWVLFYSGAMASYSGRYSYLACDMGQKIEGDSFKSLKHVLGTGRGAMENAWFGYLGYGLKDSLETLVPDQPSWPGAPALTMMRFHSVYRFDHVEKKIELFGRPYDFAHPRKPPPLPAVAELSSNMNKAAYLQKAAEVIEKIRAGDLYQANLTRKFFGLFQAPPDPYAVFCELCKKSPAPYSAFLKFGDLSIASSSPEQFLGVLPDGTVFARPIKGTAPRFDDKALDDASREKLAHSEKDRAENLMIVDLMRNDLSRNCDGIEVTSLFDITTHPTIHHMSSSITARKKPGASALEVVQDCFPPGSMTGAPKISAMNLCSRLERDGRGIYSGAIGWFGGDGSAAFSVVIRTIIMEKDRFEFQVGGGIVADSTPERELSELIDKTKGIYSALGISRAGLEAI